MERFTKKAESILNNALKIAREFGHTYVGSEHLLLAICEEEGCTALGLLSGHGLSSERLRVAILDAAGSGSPFPISAADMTPRLRAVIEHAAAAALRGGAVYIGSEHLLIGILEETILPPTSCLRHRAFPPVSCATSCRPWPPPKERKLASRRRGCLPPPLPWPLTATI